MSKTVRGTIIERGTSRHGQGTGGVGSRPEMPLPRLRQTTQERPELPTGWCTTWSRSALTARTFGDPRPLKGVEASIASSAALLVILLAIPQPSANHRRKSTKHGVAGSPDSHSNVVSWPGSRDETQNGHLQPPNASLRQGLETHKDLHTQGRCARTTE